jgi:hypothetical protein
LNDKSALTATHCATVRAGAFCGVRRPNGRPASSVAARVRSLGIQLDRRNECLMHGLVAAPDLAAPEQTAIGELSPRRAQVYQLGVRT